MPPLWHQHPPQHCIQHPLQHLTTPTTTMTSHHEPPTTHFDPGYAFRPPIHAFPSPTYVFPSPDTGFNYLRPPSSAFRSRLAPQTHVLTTNDPPACISTPTGTPGPEMHVQLLVCVFLLLFFSFWPRKHVYKQSYMRFLCFYLFIIHFYPRNMCTIACTRISYVFIHLLYIFTLKTCVWAITHAFPCKYMYASSSI